MKGKQREKYEPSRRNIELLKKYYPVNDEEKTITACFHYDTAEELFETQVNPDCMPQLQPEFLEKIHGMIPRIPRPYRLEIQLKINDFQGHKPKTIVESFSDSLEFMQFSKRADNSRMYFLSAMLVIVGYFILGMMVVGQESGWFGSDFIASIAEEVVDIAGWVFLWEAVTILFLESSERSISDPGIRKRIASFMVCNSEESMLVNCSGDELFQKWGRMDKMKSIVRHSLLISGCGFVLFGLNGLFYLLQVDTLAGEVGVEYLNFIRFILGSISICQVLAGVGGFFRFFGRRNVFTGFSKGYALCMFFVIGFSLIVLFFSRQFKELLLMLASYCCTLIYISGIFLDARISKKGA